MLLLFFVGADAAFWRHKRRVGKNDVKIISPPFFIGQGVVFVNLRRGKAVQIEVNQGKAHHVRGDVITYNVPGQPFAVVGPKFVSSEFAVFLNLHAGNVGTLTFSKGGRVFIRFIV